MMYSAVTYRTSSPAPPSPGLPLIGDAARIERLQRILHCYGDRVSMAMCHRADWQQEIDDALKWVAENPETRTLEQYREE